ncbi:hypothetical protein DID74_01155 [Candidatus Marinamargulisbacteria bacterium SCGC AG-333-B06]|nr:hypothetical protein DID74_01155 [Candidatus Marinamargulisbacteria bacterium SCGC AG-333-B06]
MKKLIVIGITLLVMMASGSIQADSMIELRRGVFGYGSEFKLENRDYWQDASGTKLKSFLIDDSEIRDMYVSGVTYQSIGALSSLGALVTWIFLTNYSVGLAFAIPGGILELVGESKIQHAVELHNEAVYKQNTGMVDFK